MAEIIKKDNRIYLIFDGFVYFRHYKYRHAQYWRCREYPSCNARMSMRSSVEIGIFRKSGILSEPSTNCGHFPDREVVERWKLLTLLMGVPKKIWGPHQRKLFRVLDDIPARVSAHFSNPTNISKMIQRQRLQDLPAYDSWTRSDPLSIFQYTKRWKFSIVWFSLWSSVQFAMRKNPCFCYARKPKATYESLRVVSL